MAATSASLCNFLSFLSPSKPPPQPKFASLQLLSSPHFPSQLHLQSKKSRDRFVPLAFQDSRSDSESLPEELASVIFPSLSFSNTLFFKSAYNVQVIVDDNEPEERLLNRFRREVMRAGVIQECKRRRYHENAQDEKKRKTREAAKRNRRRRPQSRFPFPNPQEASVTKKNDDGDDNWDLPEGGIPN